LTTSGRPRNPFGCIEEMDDVLDNLIAVNVSFQKYIEDWIDQVFEGEILL